jgi:hypothetical protein
MNRYFVSDTGAESNRIVVYNSATEFVNTLNDKGRAYMAHTCLDFHWAGGTMDSIIERALHGDESYGRKAQALLDQFGSAPLSSRYRNVPSVVGNRPIVPAAIMGHPLAMLRRVRTPETSGPLTIALSVMVSCSVPQQDVEQRGVAALALTMRLMTERPVRLIVFGEACSADRENIYNVVNINTAPLDLSIAGFIIASSGFVRGLMFAHDWMEGSERSIPWPRDRRSKEYSDNVRARLGLTSEDILVTGLHAQDHRSDMDYRAWIEENYRTHSHNCNPQ